ncbi:hypothetical protein FHR32_003498 [Streptosporangium album]|uniref:Uncharacterized protein n=1 Tax=Streptosporangium album TaxID=47479 RepID=A0A7W7W9R3_9ACTN|nr:hypothetical protein [Streptosporangium album]
MTPTMAIDSVIVRQRVDDLDASADPPYPDQPSSASSSRTTPKTANAAAAP